MQRKSLKNAFFDFHNMLDEVVPEINFQINLLLLVWWPYHAGEMGLTLNLTHPEHVNETEASDSLGLNGFISSQKSESSYKVHIFILCFFSSFLLGFPPFRSPIYLSSLPLTFPFSSPSISIYSTTLASTLPLGSATRLTFWFHSSFISLTFLQVFSWSWL